jgi:hypothetical protein
LAIKARVVEVRFVLYPWIQFLILVDHSSGHDKKRTDGLNANEMNKGYGGKKPKLRSTMIEEEDGYLGPFDRILSVGMRQSLVFSSQDEGPYWLSVEERARLKFDVRDTVEMKTRLLIKAELIEKLKAANVSHHGTMEAISKVATNNGIPLEVEEPLLEHGWVNKPKGLLQVLWERGFIDPAKADLLDYVVNDKPGCKGLRTMVAELRDFENEETRLQYVGQKLGLMIDRSPKYHPECAGEGIEYSWGCGKGMYRYLPIASKKGKDNFLKQVRVCLSSKPDTGNLRVSRIRSFARRQRRYICAYDLLHRQETERRQHPATAENEELIVVPAIIERYVKHFKCHRCIYDSERGYLGTFLRENRNISS